MDLRFRCPEDVQNTLIHHTKKKFMDNVAAKLTHANVSRMSIIERWVPRKSVWKLAGPGKASAEVCSRCPWWRQTQEHVLEPVGPRDQETRKSKEKSQGKWRESGKETECGRQWLFEEYFGENMMPRDSVIASKCWLVA